MAWLKRRRKFLARNIVAIGGIAATALTRAPPAVADPQHHHHHHDKGGGSCFLKGTKIRTAQGERKIEDLASGDLVPVLFGGMRPIQWIARYSYKKSDPSKPWPNYARPVRIARSALAPNVPQADLIVSNWHALFLDGTLVPAGNLVNGTTITLYPADEFDRLEFFHLKLAAHDVTFAEEAACESLSAVNETATNFADYCRAYGTDEALCAPLLFYNGRRGQIKSRLRSAISPWFDVREKIDIIRDRLEDRGIAFSAQRELPEAA